MRSAILSGFAFLVWTCLSLTVSAAPVHWVGGLANDSWHEPKNWLEGRVPGFHDRAVFDGAYTSHSCIMDAEVVVNGVLMVNGYEGSLVQGGGTCHVNHTAESLDVNVLIGPMGVLQEAGSLLLGRGDFFVVGTVEVLLTGPLANAPVFEVCETSVFEVGGAYSWDDYATLELVTRHVNADSFQVKDLESGVMMGELMSGVGNNGETVIWKPIRPDGGESHEVLVELGESGEVKIRFQYDDQWVIDSSTVQMDLGSGFLPLDSDLFQVYDGGIAFYNSPLKKEFSKNKVGVNLIQGSLFDSSQMNQLEFSGLTGVQVQGLRVLQASDNSEVYSVQSPSTLVWDGVGAIAGTTYVFELTVEDVNGQSQKLKGVFLYK